MARQKSELEPELIQQGNFYLLKNIACRAEASAVLKSEGFTYEGLLKGWVSPANPVAARRLERLLGIKLLPEPDSANTAVDIPAEARPEQRDIVEYLTQHPKALVALAPRMGKTPISIWAAKALGIRNALVVCPLTLLRHWERELQRWYPEVSVSIVRETNIIREGWNITNYERARISRAVLSSRQWQLLIVDESFMVKNRNALRTKAVKLLSRHSDRTWLLSGAPISRYVDDLWSQLSVLCKYETSYWRFAGRYCVLKSSVWGTDIIGNAPEAIQQIQHDYQDFYISKNWKELPQYGKTDWEIERLDWDMNKKQTLIYNQMERDFLAELTESGNKVLAPNQLAKAIRLMQIASSPAIIEPDSAIGCKWQLLPYHLDFLETPIIIWAQYIRTIDYLRKELEAERLVGSTAQDERQTIVDRFNAGEIPVLLAHPGVGQYGLSLVGAKSVIFLERNWRSEQWYQALFRTWLPHQSTARIQVINSTNRGKATIDHVIDLALEDRQEYIEKLTANRLLEYWKELNAKLVKEIWKQKQKQKEMAEIERMEAAGEVGEVGEVETDGGEIEE